jgi:glycolate oxidase iron-sulfur subunit
VTAVREPSIVAFSGPDIPSRGDLNNCIHCGFCLPACPTYIATGQELESPRGRLHLISALLDGRIEATDRTLGHLDLCLQCRACETACPSAVPYGRIMEDARASLLVSPEAAPRAWTWRARLLRDVLARRRRLRFAIRLGRLYSRSGLQSLARGPLGRLVPERLRRLEAAAPVLRDAPYRETGTLAAAAAGPEAPSARVALLLGCIHGELYPRMHEATVRVLAHTGAEVVAPPQQSCCGALHSHAGDAETARALARRNIAAFESAEVDAVIVNAAGCGAAMKEYGRLLRHDPAWGERAERFSSTVRDVLEYVADADFNHDLGPVERTVTLQDACHLAHAQGIREAPRTILEAIPGVELREQETPDRCCGSAGIYAVVQRAMSSTVLAAKMNDIDATGADEVCTSNPGCTMQLETGVRQSQRPERLVRHAIELLAESIEAGVQPS